MSLISQLMLFLATKNALKTSIRNKGVEVLDTDKMSVYPSKIAMIPAGNGGSGSGLFSFDDSSLKNVNWTRSNTPRITMQDRLDLVNSPEEVAMDYLFSNTLWVENLPAYNFDGTMPTSMQETFRNTTATEVTGLDFSRINKYVNSRGLTSTFDGSAVTSIDLSTLPDPAVSGYAQEYYANPYDTKTTSIGSFSESDSANILDVISLLSLGKYGQGYMAAYKKDGALYVVLLKEEDLATDFTNKENAIFIKNLYGTTHSLKFAVKPVYTNILTFILIESGGANEECRMTAYRTPDYSFNLDEFEVMGTPIVNTNKSNLVDYRVQANPITTSAFSGGVMHFSMMFPYNVDSSTTTSSICVYAWVSNTWQLVHQRVFSVSFKPDYISELVNLDFNGNDSYLKLVTAYENSTGKTYILYTFKASPWELVDGQSLTGISGEFRITRFGSYNFMVFTLTDAYVRYIETNFSNAPVLYFLNSAHYNKITELSYSSLKNLSFLLGFYGDISIYNFNYPMSIQEFYAEAYWYSRTDLLNGTSGQTSCANVFRNSKITTITGADKLLRFARVLTSAFEGCTLYDPTPVASWGSSAVFPIKISAMFKNAFSAGNPNIVNNVSFPNSFEASQMFMNSRVKKILGIEIGTNPNGYPRTVNALDMFTNCTLLEEITGFNIPYLPANTSFNLNGTASSPRPLRRLVFSQTLPFTTAQTFDISNCSFTRSDMLELFNSLPTGNNNLLTIKIGGNPCFNDGSLLPEDIAIATSKGCVVNTDTPISIPSVVVSSYYSTYYDGPNAIDGILSTYWFPSVSVGATIVADLLVPTLVKKLAIISGDNGYGTIYGMKGFTFSGSDDGVNYTQLLTGTFLNINTLQEKVLSSPVTYRYFKLACTSVYSSSRFYLSEFILLK